MILYALDTDSLTLLLHGHKEIHERVSDHDPAELSITIIAVEEMLTGWYTQIRKAKTDEQRLRAYAALQQAVEFCGRVRVLPLNPDALARFHDLRSRKPRIGTNDLRMAAVALAHDAILITRNAQDFRGLPGLKTEDWSKPKPD
jgi:tRNA(fMet)-specific endonuclease VapC